MPERCPWCDGDADYIRYHDNEWGAPQTDDRVLFEFLVLESFQAGLSWLTILKKRAAFRTAFAEFNPQDVARFTQKDVSALCENKAIIRNRSKIQAAVNNAERFLQIQREHGKFACYLWSYVNNRQVQNRFESMADVPATTETARMLSKDMKKRGFTFFGPTIAYAYMQAVGLVNDHLLSCPRHNEIASLTSGRKFALRSS